MSLTPAISRRSGLGRAGGNLGEVSSIFPDWRIAKGLILKSDVDGGSNV